MGGSRGCFSIFVKDFFYYIVIMDGFALVRCLALFRRGQIDQERRF